MDYNRYIMLKMTFYWKDRDIDSWAIYGQEDNMLKDELQSQRSDARYTENLKVVSFVLLHWLSKKMII